MLKLFLMLLASSEQYFFPPGVQWLMNIWPLSHWNLFWNLCKLVPFAIKLIFYRVNSQLSKEIDFEMFYFVEFSRGNFTYGVLWLVSWSVFTNIEWSVDNVVYIWLLKVYLQCESTYIQKINFEIFILK